MGFDALYSNACMHAVYISLDMHEVYVYSIQSICGGYKVHVEPMQVEF